MIGRRRNARNLCAQLLKIVWQDDSGRRRKGVAILEDISPGGACLQLDDPIPPETAISVLFPGGRYYGRVKHCDFQPAGYFIGVQFDPGYRWSKADFVPKHLLELRPRDAGKEEDEDIP